MWSHLLWLGMRVDAGINDPRPFLIIDWITAGIECMAAHAMQLLKAFSTFILPYMYVCMMQLTSNIVTYVIYTSEKITIMYIYNICTCFINTSNQMSVEKMIIRQFIKMLWFFKILKNRLRQTNANSMGDNPKYLQCNYYRNRWHTLMASITAS